MVVCAGLFGCLSACEVGPDFARPLAPAIDHYTRGSDPAGTVSAAGTVQHISSRIKIEADWYRLFKSQALDSMIAEALERNPGYEAAQASLREAQDNLRSGYGVFYPQIGGNFSAARDKVSPLDFGQNAAGSVFNLFSLSGTVTYVLDVFGGERRAVEVLGAEADVQSATERATWLALVSNLVDGVIARAAYRAELDATRELVVLETQQLKLAQVQFRAGTVAYSSVLSIQTQLETYEASLPGLEQKIVQADDLLATLAGHPPAEWKAPSIDLSALALPADLPVSLPADLIRQRPDILAAEATAHAASANIGVATAALLPNVTLSAGTGANSTALSSLFASNGQAWNIGADVAQPIFEGGTLWFKRKAAIDDYNKATALYRQTVLSAFQQTADTLNALDHDAQALAAEEQTLATAKEALTITQANYRSGVANYLDVINADAQYHQAQIGDIDAMAVRYQDTVALFAALGGGWWNERSGRVED